MRWVFIAEAGAAMLPVRQAAWPPTSREGTIPGRKPEDYLR